MTNQLQYDYLDALTFLQPYVRNVKDLYYGVDLRTGNHGEAFVASIAALPSHSEFGVPVRVVNVNVSPTYPRIERVEMNIWIAAAIWFKQQDTDEPWNQKPHDWYLFCKRVGCCPSRVNDPRERWRQLGIQQSYVSIPVTVLEDRPRCVICPGYVATGAGTTVTPKAGLLDTGDSYYRPDVHESCYRYAHEVLAPALAESRKQRKEAKVND